MLWEVDIYPQPGQPDLAARRVATEAADLGLAAELAVTAGWGYLIQGELQRDQVLRIAHDLLADRVVERTVVAPVGDEALRQAPEGRPCVVHVLPKPGVMDPVAQSVASAIADFGCRAEAVRTLKKYWLGPLAGEKLQLLCTKVLANDAIEQVIVGPLSFTRLDFGSPYEFKRATVPLRAMDDATLERLSLQGQLFLSVAEMRAIQGQFRTLDRDPTDVELETLAQTWSEHCSHKTLAGRIHYRDGSTERRFENMLKETIFAATQEIRRELGSGDWCVSVFEDNAGVVRFDDDHHVVFKVETHNHPSALEPYGGANTGIGGVIRDPMGTGLGAKPVANTDVFCFAPPDTPADQLPPGVLHPRRVMRGVVAGVRDYGNRMGIPTVNGAIYFDPRYLGNPLVYCGNIGLIPVDRARKEARPGDLVVTMGGRTGRDGIHGATFSSAELTSQSETISGGAVQIGNAITEKMLLDVLLVARDRGLYHAVTDCGAGGLSSAVGEMGEHIGAEVWLDRVPLKYEGLSYTEIWISEAQERMVLAVPTECWEELSGLCASEGVEATVIGKYVPTGRLLLKYMDEVVADLDMDFLHDGRPPVVREAVYTPPPVRPLTRISALALGGLTRVSPLPLGEGQGVRASDSQIETTLQRSPHPRPFPKGQGTGDVADATLRAFTDTVVEFSGVGRPADYTEVLLRILGSLNVASKEWVIRQYDHEVQGGSVVKPLVGIANDGPSDAAVLRPVLKSRRGLVIACGMNPRYGDLDTYWMAASAIDEAVRNCVAVGADPARIAILDNFCWGNTDRPETLGSLVRAALACHDVAVALGTPFISGKDSLNNEFRPAGAVGRIANPSRQDTISIPPSLLISALGQIDHVSRAVTMDLKEPGNDLYLVGLTKNELAGSHFALVEGLEGGEVPKVDSAMAKRTFAAVHHAIRTGRVRACHDLSEGGLAVAAAEMAFAGGLGLDIDVRSVPCSPDAADPAVVLFSESNTRFLCEVPPRYAEAFEATFAGPEPSNHVPCRRIGTVIEIPHFQVRAESALIINADLKSLKEAWQKPLRW